MVVLDDNCMRGDGRIYRRGEIFFIAYSIGGREFRESTGSRECADAQRLLAARIRERDHARAAAASTPNAPTFDDLASAYLAEYALREHRSAPTARGRVEHLRACFGGLLAAAITAIHITRYQTLRRQAGMAAASVNRETAALHRMFAIARRSGVVTATPVFPPRLRENPPRQGFFEMAEYRAIRAHLPAPYQDVLDFAYYTGWRRREITELTWQEVDWEGGVVRLDPHRSKTATGRVLPLTPALRAVLERRRARRRADSVLVFHKDDVTVRTWKLAWATACRAAHLPGRYLHDCRRTAARNLVRAGVPERVAMTLLGHKTRSVFDRYNIVCERELHQAGERLMAYLNAQELTD
jgi:integrase